MGSRTLPLLLAIVALAGCTSLTKDEGEAVGPAEDQPAVARPPGMEDVPTPSSSPQPASPSPANATANGDTNATSSNATTPAPPANETVPRAPEIVVLEANFTAKLLLHPGEPTGTFGARGVEVRNANFTLPEAGPRRATLTVSWEPTGEDDVTLEVRFFDEDENTIAQGSGESPLLFEIPGDAFGESLELYGRAVPPAPGIAGPDIFVVFTLELVY